MTTLFKIARAQEQGRWQGLRLAGATVALAAVTVALVLLAPVSVARADGWTLQSVASSVADGGLSGVSCPYTGIYSTTSPCVAVGAGLPAGALVQQPLIEYWNGSQWSNELEAGPGGPSFAGRLSGVSCPTTAFCMAVGGYDSPQADSQLPLVYTIGPGGWVQQQVNIPGASFNSVSCQSSSFCVAVGQFSGGGPVAAVWTPSTGFVLQQPAANTPTGVTLDSVSCAAAQSGFCLAVGFGTDQGHAKAYAEAYENGQWVLQTSASSGGYLPAQPGNTLSDTLTGVYCLTAQDCQVVGSDIPSSGGTELWGAELSSSSWTLESLPPSNTEAGGGAVVCPSDCWAVGSYFNGSSRQPLADNLNGSQWLFASLPSPSSGGGNLNAVSCAQINYCEAVGTAVSAGGFGATAFAERYTYTPPAPPPGGGKCTEFDCPPPKPGTPHHFSLSARGSESRGATVTATLGKPKTLVLLGA